jgi:hypothetical protein
MLLVRQPSPKGRGAYMLKAKKSLADDPALRSDGPRSGPSAVQTVRGGGADGPRVRRDS